MDLKRYQGVFAAAPTPFLADGTVDRKTAAELTGYYIEGGLSGIFALSSTGEYFAMTPKQRLAMVDATVEAAAGRIPVLAMVSDACLETVLENIRTIADHNVDGVVLTAPYYFKYSQNELYGFFSKAAEASKVPLLMYNQPTRLPSALSEELTLRLADHPNIIGLKDTSAEAARLARMAALVGGREDFLYYAGSESLAAYGALCGVNYVYALASIEPRFFVKMLAMAKQGDVRGVLQAQQRVDALCKLFRAIGGGSAKSFNNFAAGIKAALEVKGFGKAYTAQLGGLPTDAEYEAIRRILEQTP